MAVTDLTRAEADIVIATLHPTAEMAETDEDVQRELLGGLEAEEAELRKLIDEMMSKLERQAAKDQEKEEDVTGDPNRGSPPSNPIRILGARAVMLHADGFCHCVCSPLGLSG